MKQLVEELKIYSYDSNVFDSRRELLRTKNILYDCTNQNAGTMIIPKADSTTFYQLSHVNYVFLTSQQNFNLVIDDYLVMNTRHFSYLNSNSFVSVAIQSRKDIEQEIEFSYGRLRYGDEDKGVTAANTYYSAEWDKTLKNIMFTVNPGDILSQLQTEENQVYLNFRSRGV